MIFVDKIKSYFVKPEPTPKPVRIYHCRCGQVVPKKGTPRHKIGTVIKAEKTYILYCDGKESLK